MYNWIFTFVKKTDYHKISVVSEVKNPSSFLKKVICHIFKKGRTKGINGKEVSKYFTRKFL